MQTPRIGILLGGGERAIYSSAVVLVVPVNVVAVSTFEHFSVLYIQ